MQREILVALLVLLGCKSSGDGGREYLDHEESGAEGAAAAGSFATARVHFEQNATDEDVEVVFEVKGGDVGLATLRIVAPGGRVVVDFRAPDRSTLGMRQFRFESPEPGDVASLQSAYPEGVYTFRATSLSGDRLQGEATLSHALPPPTTFLVPEADAEGVEVEGLIIEWTAVPNVAAYIVYVEHDERSLTARIPGETSEFAVPEEFLRAGTEYQLGIGTERAGGNVSFVETTFVTASRSR